MRAPAPRFAIAADPSAESTGFARAVLRRLEPKLLLLAFGLLCATQVLGRLAYFGQTRWVWPAWYWKASLLIESLLIASVMLALLIADEAVARGARRWPTYVGAVVAGCAVATWAQWELHVRFGWIDLNELQPLRVFFSAVLYGMLACFVYVSLNTARLAADRLRAAELARANSRRRTLESRLQAMQARVEPQFLFNTLAQVREQYDRDPAVGGRVLDDLIAYLRAALPHLRESSSTLDQEIELARAYLDIARVRLGGRFDFGIDVPAAVKGARLPPMMLLPLIDHALACGLQPGGAGSIRITAQAEGGRLRLCIDDSGAGFVAGGPLANIAERLRALYGDDARLELERTRGRGTRATLDIPFEGSGR